MHTYMAYVDSVDAVLNCMCGAMLYIKYSASVRRHMCFQHD